MMLKLLLIACILGSIVCPPVKEPTKDKRADGKAEDDEKDKPLGLQYERYLKEVVNILEEDEGFRRKLESANISDIKSGDIAQHLEFVSHRVRSQLDELKRKEVERLNMIKKMVKIKEEMNDPERARLRQDNKIGFRQLPDIGKKMAESLIKLQGLDNVKNGHDRHIDMRNPETFEIDDLKKLIVQATNDLEDMDKTRRGDFKTYEMEKEALRREKLKQMTERERQEAEERFKQMKKKHQEHPKVNHPGSKDQLKEVWEDGDGLDADDFDPKTFFYMHDTNGDGVLDYVEVEALFQRELDKVYDEDATEDDMMERYEEMSRMREHLYKEVDTDRDGLVSLEEFLDSSRDPNFDEQEEWDTLDDEEVYTDEEMREFEEQVRERMRHQAFDGQAQPGEIHVPVEPSVIPQIHDNLAAQGHDNVQQMQQQDFQQNVQQQLHEQQQQQQLREQQQLHEQQQQHQLREQQQLHEQQRQNQQFEQPPKQEQHHENQQEQHIQQQQVQQQQEQHIQQGQQEQQVHQQDPALDPQAQQQQKQQEDEKLRLLQEQQHQRQQEFEQNQQRNDIQQQADDKETQQHEQILDEQNKAQPVVNLEQNQEQNIEHKIVDSANVQQDANNIVNNEAIVQPPGQ